MRMMKPLVVALFVVAMWSCEHRLESHTKVFPDGRLHRVFVRESKDSVIALDYLGLTQAGWEIDSVVRVSDQRYRIAQSRIFLSAKASNLELDAEGRDSLLRIHSHFEKRFRWFYTYYDYSETFRALNRFSLPLDPYVTERDFQFIDRLPPDGQSLTQADSVSLDSLQQRISDRYAARAYFEAFVELMKSEETDPKKRDAIDRNRTAAFQLVAGDSLKNMEDFLPELARRLGVDTAVLQRETFLAESKRLEGKISFMVWAAEAKYQHEIEMPGTLVATNADSIAFPRLMWSPSALKFHFRDYTMQATTRQPNYWAWAVSVLLMVATVVYWVRRKK